MLRSPAEHATLVEALQAEWLADDLQPPDGSRAWTAETLRCWFEDGGLLTLRALKCDDVNALNPDTDLGTLLPTRRLALLEAPPLADALQRRDPDYFALLARRLSADGWVACRLGLGSALWEQARSEGALAWPLMRPNHVSTKDGSHPAL